MKKIPANVQSAFICGACLRMPIRNGDLSGSAPGRAAVALLIIDMINDMEFEGGKALQKFAVPMAEKILELKRY